MIGALVVAIAGGLLLALTGARFIGSLVIIASAVGLLLVVLQYLLLPRYKSAQNAGKTRSLLLDDDGIAVRVGSNEAFHRWYVFSDTIEQTGMYWIKTNARRSYLCVPERALRSPHDKAEFMRLVREHTVVTCPEYSGSTR